MRPEYLETRFRVQDASVTWPQKFAIISAFATTGETWTEERNRAADLNLKTKLSQWDGSPIRVVGYSPKSGHAEPSWAAALQLHDSLTIARNFLQDAIYYVEADALSVVSCREPMKQIGMGSFRSRLDVQ